MLIHIIAQIPTPTPFNFPTPEPGSSIVIDATAYRIWSYTDDAINVWNRGIDFFVVFQWVTIIILIIGFVYLMTNLIRELINSDDV